VIVVGYPTTLHQFPEVGDHIPWANAQGSESISTGSIIRSAKDLYHLVVSMSDSSSEPVLSKTWYIVLSNFQFTDSDSISGLPKSIKVHMDISRRGRIVDDTIRLVNGIIPVSQNIASYLADEYNHITISDKSVIGGDLSEWQLIDDLTIDSNFGIMLRFQSNPIIPHRDPVLIRDFYVTMEF